MPTADRHNDPAATTSDARRAATPAPPRRFATLRDRLRRRVRAARPGSVLILVVALLVLMALIGTAFISTSQTDRYASNQNQYNTQVDMLVDGVVAACLDQIERDVLVPSPTTGGAKVFRADTDPVPPSGVVGGYNNTTGVGITMNGVSMNPSSSFLADRLPSVPAGTSTAVWLHISDNPMAQQNVAHFGTPQNSGQGYSMRYSARPTFVSITDSSGVSRNYPALAVPADPQTGGGAGTYLAADTDGDGIADAGLFGLPVSQINGVTYFAAVRIIDNASAINASVALKQNTEFTDAPHLAGNNFNTNIDLMGALGMGNPATAQQELNQVLAYRTLGKIGDSTSTTIASAASAYKTPYNDFKAPRSDFVFDTPYEAQWAQIGVRVGNPGYLSPSQTYQTFSLSDSIALANRGCLVSPSASQSVIERVLPTSTFTNAAVNRLPFDPSQAGGKSQSGTWYGSIYDYENTGAGMPARPLLVARNPVSTFVPNRFPYRGTWTAAGSYKVGDWVTGVDQRAYICLCDNSNNSPTSPGTASINYWAQMPWTSHPTKISVNTATQQQLMAYYWAIMERAPNTATGQTGTRQFRNPIRDRKQAGDYYHKSDNNPPYKLTGAQMRQVRAALAAVNTVDLRDTDTPDFITSMSLTFPGNPQYTVTVYGTEKRPYITDALVQTVLPTDPTNAGGRPVRTATTTPPAPSPDPQNLYVAIEIYNPYSVALDIKNISFATVDPLTAPNLTMSSIGKPTFSGGTSMPPGAHWVIENDPYNRPLDVVIAPQGTLPGLIQLTQGGVGKELYMMSNDAPLDQLDFHGITYPESTENRYRYSRPAKASTTPGGPTWMCVYPGSPLVPNANPPPGPILAANWKKTAGKGAGDPPTLGKDKDKADSTYTDQRFRTIQVANTDMPGPEAANSVRYPFGGFPRTGDIMDVTFIGSYYVRQGTSTAGAFLDAIALTGDSVRADDEDDTNDYDAQGGPVENVGRFSPIIKTTGTNNDDTAPGTIANPSGAWRYNFALDLFDYLDIRSPQQDMLPNLSSWPTAVSAVTNGPVTDPAKANDGSSEDISPDEGKVNINTAQWRVLAAVPLVPNNPGLTKNLAQAIVNYRDTNDGTGKPHGPFKNLFELNKVPGFQAALGDISLTADTDDDKGDLSPLGQGNTDKVIGDFETQYLEMIRISNMVTTRSDSFTGYVLVQGWRNVGSGTPELVVQRRAGFIVDRSTMKPLQPPLAGTVQTRSKMSVTRFTPF